MKHNVNQELQSFWDGKAPVESEREKNNPRKQVHTDLIWREISRCIGKRKRLNILDAGAGSGRFSIPLAETGHKVIHFDISPKMIEIAREQCVSRKLSTIEFIRGSIDDLSGFKNNSFDLVLCIDSPLSFCFNSYKKALRELVRVCKSTIILCVMNKSGVISEGGVNFDLKHFGRLKTAPEVYNTGMLLVTDELRRLQPLMPSWHAFSPNEIKGLLSKTKCRIKRISAPGSLVRFVDSDLLKQLLNNPGAYQHYLDFEEQYDSDINNLGLGAKAGGGLLVSAIKTIGLGKRQPCF